MVCTILGMEHRLADNKELSQLFLFGYYNLLAILDKDSLLCLLYRTATKVEDDWHLLSVGW